MGNTYESYPHILSSREQNEYITSCPVQIKRSTLSIPAENSPVVLTVKSAAVFRGNWKIKVNVSLTDAKRGFIGDDYETTVTVGECVSDLSIPENAVYAFCTVMEVSDESGVQWTNTGHTIGSSLPEQKVIWSSDKYSEQIHKEFNGVREPKYYPDRPAEGMWRCTCGQINQILDSHDTCCSCGCERVWMDEVFSEEYLEKRILAAEEHKSEPKAKMIKEREGMKDSTKAIILLVCVIIVIGGIIATPQIIKAVKYSKAADMLAAKDYDNAIAAFTELGTYSDSKTQLYYANYGKAQQLTGIDDVNMTTSKASPWFEIDENGVLSFDKDDYTGSWDDVVIPDVVDGVVVRELERNFFLNCKEMTKVTISDCVEVLGEQTFFNCYALTDIVWGKNVHEIGARAFINCTSIKEIVIPSTVTKIGLRAFNSCEAVEKIILGTGITTIPSYLFSCCYMLTDVVINGTVNQIGESAFAECYSLATVEYNGGSWSDIEILEGNDLLSGAQITSNN